MKRRITRAVGAAILTAATGGVNVASFLTAYGLLWALERAWDAGRRGRLGPGSVVRWIRFLADFLWDLAKSNLLMAWDVVTPWDYHHVEIVEVPVADLSRREIVLLIHRITLTPGTLTCGLDKDRRYLLVHAMYGAPGDLAGRLRRPVDILKGRC